MTQNLLIPAKANSLRLSLGQNVESPGPLCEQKIPEESLSGIHELECSFFRGNTFIPQPHQNKAKKIYQKLEKGQRGILLYHKFGSGKTCTSILIADYLLNEPNNNLNQVYVLTPGNLRRNFHHEYCFVCGTYVDNFKNNYTFISYNYGQLKTSSIQFPDFNNSIVIIDEIHNLIKANINAMQNKESVAKAITTKLNNAINVKIIALSGDPIYSKPDEAGYIFELLKPSLNKDEVNNLLTNPELFKKSIQNLVSYVPGKEIDFPQIIDHIVECEMSDVQKNAFFPIQEMEDRIRTYRLSPAGNDEEKKKMNRYIIIAKLYIRTRRASNFYYPPWAGINAAKEPEEEPEEESEEESKKKSSQPEINLEIENIRAELGEPVEEDEKQDALPTEQKEVLKQYAEDSNIEKCLYIVVAKDGVEIAEFPDGNSAIIKHIPQGKSFFKIRCKVEFPSKNQDKWCVKLDDTTGWITLPKKKIDKNAIVVPANTSRPDKVVPKGWVNNIDFEGNLELYSRKFFAVLQKISENFNGKHALFSFFKTRGGLRLMGSFLEMCGISYRLYTGDENDEEKTRILTEYNSSQNKNGELIKILLFSFAGSEGMTLTAVQHLHILETDLREGRARQVIGRTARYKSHHMLPDNQQKVNVWRYWSVTSSNENEDKGVDRKLYNQALDRYKAIQQVLNYFEEASIERMGAEEKDDDPLIEVYPKVSDDFKIKGYNNIRYALNRLLYWNHYLLNKKKMKIHTEKIPLFKKLIFDPVGYIYQINKNNTLKKFNPNQFKARNKRDYLNCKKMSQKLVDGEIKFLQNIQEQKDDSELMRLFPIILEDTKKIVNYINKMKIT